MSMNVYVREMALIPKKTYSKHSNEISLLCEREKENIDPFDELLSSPLKQEVQFQPLSFWGRKIKNPELKKKYERTKCGLYESSDSDEHDSPHQRKRKCNSKNSVTKPRTLQNKSVKHKLSIRKNSNYSTANSFFKGTKPNKTVIPNENTTLVSVEDFEKNKGWYLSNTSNSNDNLEETLMLPFKNCNNLKFFNQRAEEDKANCNNHFNKSLNNNTAFLFKSKKNSTNLKELCNNINPKNSEFKINGNANETVKQVGNTVDGEVIFKEDPASSIINFDENMEEAFPWASPCYKDCEILKYITVKRGFNYPNCFNFIDENFNCLKKSSTTEKTNRSPSQHWSNSDSNFDPNHLDLKVCHDVSLQPKLLRNIINETSTSNGEDPVDSSLYYDNVERTFCVTTPATPESEELKKLCKLEFHDENTLLGDFDFARLNNTETEDLILELLEQQNSNITVNGGLENSNSTSEDTLSEITDKDSVIRISTEPERNNVFTGFDLEKDNNFYSPSNEVSQLTRRISNLTISSGATPSELLKSEVEKLEVLLRDEHFKDEENCSLFVDLRKLSTKSRGSLNVEQEQKVSCMDEVRSNAKSNETQKTDKSQTELELDHAFELKHITDRMSVDWSKSVLFSNPIFESTRVADVDLTEEKLSQKVNVLDETGLDYKFALKPGKKWFRSMSVLKQLQNRSLIEESLESTKIRGRNFESFVQDMLEMQNGSNKKNSFFSTLNGYQTILEFENMQENESYRSRFLSGDDTISSKSASSTLLERSVLNRTVKLIQPKEGPSAFRSALGLEINHSDIQDDSVEEESFISARDFVLMQCGQEDVLPFEEHFNERTLKNCKKIGEGVYGEVFMSSDSVIKIIPIEGSEKVNGEPQKTFEEIISEVVIALQLSNLRKGEKHRTDCFSEMKRCWCVKGKYPKLLLKLWKDYDQLGSGSENDSPVMFNEDQLYIILELANGGKDLESFVFSSAAQSLSIFIQAAFGLAAAEKAFEFEHRDLHWGNVLISETQKKFTTVVLDGIEYKVPTKGVKICIIDFTLSRINYESCCIFNDLSADPGLFSSEGDYQFEIYRMMLAEVKNDWSLFRPRTNLFWLHYMIDKMLKMVRYKNKKAKVHTKHFKYLKILESVVLEHKDSENFLLSESLSNIVNKL